MVNLSALQNLPPLQINTSVLDDAATNLIPSMQEVAVSASDGYFTIGVLTVFFLFLVIVLFKQDESIRLPIAKTMLLSSGFTVILGVFMLLLNFSSEVQPVLWFLMIFIISTLINYILKSKGQSL